jgi:hypothetical protein
LRTRIATLSRLGQRAIQMRDHPSDIVTEAAEKNTITQPKWEFHWAILSVSLADGSKKHGLVMRRKFSDTWQYRKATPDEEVEYDSQEAW